MRRAVTACGVRLPLSVGRSRLAVSAGGRGSRSRLAVSARGLGWRSRLAVSVGGLGWRSRLAVSVGGLGWRSRLALSAGGLGWRSVRTHASCGSDASCPSDEILRRLSRSRMHTPRGRAMANADAHAHVGAPCRKQMHTPTWARRTRMLTPTWARRAERGCPRPSQICVRGPNEEILEERRIPTKRLGEYLAKQPHSRVILETSAEAFAVADLAKSAGHDVRVVPSTLAPSLGVGAHGIKTDATRRR
jgi:hypothetical protein